MMHILILPRSLKVFSYQFKSFFLAFVNSSLVKAPDSYNSFRVFNCSVKSPLSVASILRLDSTYKFEGFIIFKKSVEPLHFSTLYYLPVTRHQHLNVLIILLCEGVI